ncbi:MAG: hypothetical protein HKP58_13070 [Desulfatitalea sp.]|nr:hypothetical protein [Desulfatitalea sp.]
MNIVTSKVMDWTFVSWQVRIVQEEHFSNVPPELDVRQGNAFSRRGMAAVRRFQDVLVESKTLNHF